MSISRTTRKRFGALVLLSALGACTALEGEDTIGASNDSLITSSIHWTQLRDVNVTANGSTITKSGGSGSNEDAGAISQERIVSGDGFVETTIQQIGAAGSGSFFRWIGLTSSATWIPGLSMEYGLRLQEKNVEVYENGKYKWGIQVNANDKVRIGVSAGAITYYRNGTPFYRSFTTATYPLRANVTFITANGALHGVAWGETQSCPQSGGPISGLAANVSGTNATIVWTTPVASNSSVEYANNVNFTGARWASGSGTGTNHSVTLEGLAGGTTYHYRVYSSDLLSGTSAQSADKNFAVAPACPSGPFARNQPPPACWRPYAQGNADTKKNSPFNNALPPLSRLTSAHFLSQDQARWAQYMAKSLSPYPANMAAREDGSGGWPTYYATASDPEYRIDCPECPAGGLAVRIPVGAERQQGRWGTAGDDRHITIIDQSKPEIWEYDIWQFNHLTVPASTAQRLSASSVGKTRFGGLGLNEGPGQGMAARTGNLAGRIRVEELKAGKISHALSITLRCSDPSPAVWPAVPAFPDPNWNPSTKCARELGNELFIPFGARLVLAVPLEALDGNTANGEIVAQPWQKTILRAMVEYGMFFADTDTAEGGDVTKPVRQKSGNYFAIQAESGNMYSSMGVFEPNCTTPNGLRCDPWYKFGIDNGWDGWTNDKGVAEKVAKLQNLTWQGQSLWTYVRVLKHCVSDGTCLP